MLSEAMLSLGVDQSEAVDKPPGTPCIEQQTFALRPRNCSRSIAIESLPRRALARRLRSEEWRCHQVCPLAQNGDWRRFANGLSAASLGAFAKREGSSRLR